MTNEIQKPFLKWVGGKSQNIKHFINKIPNQMNNYYEPFLGGGSVLFTILSLQKDNKITITNKIYASDINEGLIYLYKNIQNNYSELFSIIESFMNDYNSISEMNGIRNPNTLHDAKSSKESFYYYMRNLYNNNNDKKSIEASALFLILNKTGFRGMYREGPNGFNVPYGNYKTSPKFSKNEFENISNIIKNVNFIHCDYTQCINNCYKNDFVYLDPPYVPETDSSFVNYNVCGFDKSMHEKLFTNIHKLHKNDVLFILSNSKVNLVLDNFKSFKMIEFDARRAINSKNPASKTKELIIFNC